jgi:RHS repeat-associated protein
LAYESYRLALTEELLTAVLADRLTPEIREDLATPDRSGYLSGELLRQRFPAANTTGQYWIRSGVAGFSADAAERFFLPDRYRDPFGHTTTLEYDPLLLFPRSTTDPVGNRTEVVRFNHRVLAAEELRDPNGNLAEVAFDGLGMPVALALKGKGEEGDGLEGMPLEIEGERLIRFFTGDYDAADARALLGPATTRHLYWFGEERQADGQLRYSAHPACSAGLAREVHHHQPGGASSPLQAGFEYSDGLGTVLVRKQQAEPEGEDAAEGEGEGLRWIATGKTILNNKGKPVLQYEPYFSPGGHRFEEPMEVGVTPILYYDTAGRQVRTELPDGTVQRVAFTPWWQESWDGADTLLEPGNRWLARRTDPAHPDFARYDTPENRRAARLAVLHANTPAVTHLDSLGREVVAISHNRWQRDGAMREEKAVTFSKLDAEGKPLWIEDARGNRVMEYITPPGAEAGYTPCYDIAGNVLAQYSMDGGGHWMVADAAGQPFHGWDANERAREDGSLVLEQRRVHTTYDALRRPLEQRLHLDGGAALVVERFVYGEAHPEAEARNLRGQAWRHDDPSGLVMQQRFDFQGNLLEASRQLTRSHRESVIDWATETPSEEVFSQRTSYDALGRMSRQENWHREGQPPTIYSPRYNQRGVLAGESLTVRGQETQAIRQISYDAKGQRTRIAYGNGTATRYHYDPETFRLLQLRTTRNSPGERLPEPPSLLRNANVLQNLYYTYDPVGNISEILDDAYEPVFFNNQRVEPRNRYSYDALYRLIEASGRENHQVIDAPDRAEAEPYAVRFPISDQALRNYSQSYAYDAVGNILEIRHRADGGSWTRQSTYATNSNRLLRSWTGDGRRNAVDVRYDSHGSMLNLANTPEAYGLRWDYRDMIHRVNLGGGGQAFYTYDAGKQRSRKRIEHNGNRVEERLYLGGMEVYRRWLNGSLVEEIETHHLFAGKQRLLIVEDVQLTDNPNLTAGVLHRYQYGNHLGSVSLELTGDEDPQVISYEEYHPYGTTAYRARNAALRATAKRYRYTGMERDEETGLSYHTARYYLPWLGRWGSCDPIGIQEVVNIYIYSCDTCIVRKDSNGLQSFDSFLEFRSRADSSSLVDDVRAWREHYSLDGFLEYHNLREEADSPLFDSLHFWLEEHYSISTDDQTWIQWALVPEEIRELYVMQGLVDRGLTPEAAAGISGNLYYESRFLPNAIEGSSFVVSHPGDLPTPMVARGFDDVLRAFSPREIMDRSLESEHGPRKAGIGLAQWTTTERRRGLFEFIFGGTEYSESGASILFSLEAQIEYLVFELGEREINRLNRLTAYDASDRFLHQHERPGSIIFRDGERSIRIERNESRTAIPEERREQARRVYEQRSQQANHILERYQSVQRRIGQLSAPGVV